MTKQLEICAGDIASVQAAALGGAHRVELCSALAVGGVTPSLGFVKMAVQVPGIKKHVLIRHREGDFVYSPDEIDAMVEDIKAVAAVGADGVVVGALTPSGTLDIEACQRFAQVAHEHNLSLTFHRAFDCVSQPLEAMEQLIAMGYNRILTSGQQSTALAGVELLAQLNKAANGRIIILAGSGVSSANAAQIVEQSGCSEVHASARKPAQSHAHNPEGVAMGSDASADSQRLITDINEVKSIILCLKNL